MFPIMPAKLPLVWLAAVEELQTHWGHLGEGEGAWGQSQEGKPFFDHLSA